MWGSVFPGQGSQHTGMGKFLWDNFTGTQRRFEEASDLLGVHFKKLCFGSSESELALTENTQPALLLVSTCLSEALAEYPLQISAGHSVGEYGALVSTGVLSFSDAIRAVRVRGKAMQEAVPVGKGGMLAVIGLHPQQVKQLCDWATKECPAGPLEPANYNAPGQIVVSGSLKTIKFLRENYTSDLIQEAPKKVRFIPLKVSAPFHCSMMKPAQEIMKDFLDGITFSKPKYTIIQNVSAKEEADPKVLKENLIQQVTQSVRWVESIQKIKALGSNKIIEMGSGKVLSGLIKKIDPEITVYNINSLDEFKGVENVFTQK